jgi:sialic acid synthase SpsE
MFGDKIANINKAQEQCRSFHRREHSYLSQYKDGERMGETERKSERAWNKVLASSFEQIEKQRLIISISKEIELRKQKHGNISSFSTHLL